MFLTLENNVTKQKYGYNLEDIADSRMFYHFNIELETGLDDGEYTYNLFDDETDNEPLASGLCQIGDYVGSTTSYVPVSGTTFIQYNGSIK